MEESFPRGGKKSASSKSDGGPPTKRKRVASGDGKKKMAGKKSKRSTSPDPLAALWTRKLTAEICVPDLLVLGCVRTIMDESILLELPDGLRAILSITDISSVLTEQLLRHRREAMAKDRSDPHDERSTDSTRLQDFFVPGQLIGCRILPQMDGKPEKKKKRPFRLSVTVDPARVNSNLSFAAVTEGMILNGAIKSVEEKGYLVELGLGSSAPGSLGFLPFDQCRQTGDQSKRLHVGQVLLCAVTDAPSKNTAEKRVIRLSTLPAHLNGNSDFQEKHMRKEQYFPGLVVKSTVEKIVPNKGLVVRLAKSGGGCYKGFVSKWRLQQRGSQPTDYKPQQSLKVAILFTIPNSTVFGLSAESHLTIRAAEEGARTDLFEMVKIGDLVDGRVIASSPKSVFFDLLHSKQKKSQVIAKAGRLQLEAPEEDEDSESRFAVGSKHRFRVTGYSMIDRIFLADTRKTILNQPILDVESCVPGTLVQASVWKTINEKGVFVRLYDRINGYIPFLHCHDTPLVPGGLKRLDQKFTPGKVIKARILYGDVEKNRVILTSKKKLVSSQFPTIVNNFDSAFAGEQAVGFIVQINAERGLLVAFYGKARGWLPKAELEKFGFAVNQKLSDVFYLGQVIQVRIREVDAAKERMLLSPAGAATPAAETSEKENATTLSARDIKKEPISVVKKGGALLLGKIYTATITKVQKMQLDILIENRHHGRVFVTEISDSFAYGSVPVANYCVGQAVLVKVIAIRTKKHHRRKRNDSKGSESEVLGGEEGDGKKTFHFADCSMKKTKIQAKSAKKRVIGYKDEFQKGDAVNVAIEEFIVKDGVIQGCRVVANPNWKGDIPILHMSIDVNILRKPRDHFSPGQVVMARVTGLQASEKHLHLTCLSAKALVINLGVKTRVLVKHDGKGDHGIKCQLIDGSYGFICADEIDGSEVKIGQILEVCPVGKLSGGRWRLSTKSSVPVGIKVKEEPGLESVVSKKQSVEEEEDVKPGLTKDATSEATQKMKQAASFSWDAGRFSMANLMNLCLDEQEEGSAIKEEATANNHKKASKSKFERERMEEDELLQKEMSLLNPDRPLETKDDFDRLVMGSPDSSLIWIRYMAFFLQKGDVAKAKAVAERALKTISVREDKERFNVWTALLNLENAYGTDESFRRTFEEALAVNDPLKIYQLTSKILRRSNKIEECDKLYIEMLSKFKAEFDVWVSMGDYYMSTERPDKARELMRRAMKSLPQARHVDLISRFAQMEYRYSKDTEKTKAVGDPERGRTLFENVLRDCPKRTDVWSVYIDLTSKFQSIDEARPIFERVTSMKLNTHNMRLFYKKWLEMEERLGSPETLGQVKKRATEYVQGSLAKLPAMADDDDAGDIDELVEAVDEDLEL